MIAKEGAIDPLINLLKNGTVDGKKWAAWTLAYLSFNSMNKEVIQKSVIFMNTITSLLDDSYETESNSENKAELKDLLDKLKLTKL